MESRHQWPSALNVAMAYQINHQTNYYQNNQKRIIWTIHENTPVWNQLPNHPTYSNPQIFSGEIYSKSLANKQKVA